MRAHLTLTVHDQEGQVVAERKAWNSVMLQGAQLVAQLFAGTGAPITHMVVGSNDTPEADSFTTTELQVDPEELTGETSAPISTDAFIISTDETHRLIRVRVRGTLPQDAAVGRIREAGLISRSEEGDVLYNRVIVNPIDKGDDHELTLFWEVTFPYGDLSWM